jgi:ABC-type glycerol-3-phosphate transport system permease component
MKSNKTPKVLKRVLLYTVVVLFSLAFAMPVVWMVSTSLKTDPQVYTVPPIWIPNPVRWVNYPEALSSRPFATYALNSLKYGLLAATGAVLSNAIVGYGFARIEWPGREALFFVCITAMMLPFQVRMIPLYLIFKDLQWLNTYKPLIIPAFLGGAYHIFLFRQFYLTIPRELSEAALIDGANEIGILVRIILPLSKPIIAVVGLQAFMAAWNNYIGPLIYLNTEDLFPIALGLRSFRSSFQEAHMWPYLMAASTVATAPIIFIFFFVQRTFIEGISVTGLKG